MGFEQEDFALIELQQRFGIFLPHCLIVDKKRLSRVPEPNFEDDGQLRCLYLAWREGFLSLEDPNNLDIWVPLGMVHLIYTKAASQLSSVP